MRRSIRWCIHTSLLAVACASALSGCDGSIYQSPGGIRLDGQSVEIAVCEVIVGTEIRVFGDQTRGQEVEDYIWATGDIELRPEAPLSTGAVPENWEAEIWAEPKVGPGATVALFVYDKDGGVEFPIEFTIPASGLSDTLWTRADGRQEEEACD